MTAFLIQHVPVNLILSMGSGLHNGILGRVTWLAKRVKMLNTERSYQNNQEKDIFVKL